LGEKTRKQCERPRSLDIKISKYQNIKISKYQNIKISKYQNIKISKYQHLNISIYVIFKENSSLTAKK